MPPERTEDGRVDPGEDWIDVRETDDLLVVSDPEATEPTGIVYTNDPDPETAIERPQFVIAGPDTDHGLVDALNVPDGSGGQNRAEIGGAWNARDDSLATKATAAVSRIGGLRRGRRRVSETRRFKPGADEAVDYPGDEFLGLYPLSEPGEPGAFAVRHATGGATETEQDALVVVEQGADRASVVETLDEEYDDTRLGSDHVRAAYVAGQEGQFWPPEALLGREFDEDGDLRVGTERTAALEAALRGEDVPVPSEDGEENGAVELSSEKQKKFERLEREVGTATKAPDTIEAEEER